MARKISEILAQPALESQAARLAQEYADAARAASRRLEQCATMIEAGDDLQALQLAEVAPPLLDLITLLDFRQAAEWRTYCQAHGLPWAEPFLDKSLRLLNTTYGKGLTANSPYFAEYRKARMKNDDARALALLRVIARINPGDPNTVKDLEQMEQIVLKSRLEGLRLALESADPAAIFSQLDEIEASGFKIPPQHPVWQQAQLLRCETVLSQAEALRQQDAWQEAELALQDLQALAARHSVLFPTHDQERFSALESWVAGLRKAAAEEQDFQRAFTALEYQVGAVEAKRRAHARATANEWQNEYDALAAKWRDAERFNRPLDEQFLIRCEQGCKWIQGRMRDQTRRKRFWTGVTTVLFLAALAAGGFFGWDYLQEKDLLARGQTLQAGRRVADAEQWLAGMPARMKTKPRVAAAAEEARQFVARERERQRLFDQKLLALREAIAPRSRLTQDQVERRRAECNQALEAVAPELQLDCKGRLLAVDQQWQNRLAAAQPEHNAEFSGLLAQAEKLSAEHLNATNSSAGVRASLFSLQKLAADLDRLRQTPGPLDEALTRRFNHLTNQVAFWGQAADQWDQLRSPSLDSFEEYTNWLGKRAQSPFASPAEVEGVRDNLQLKTGPETLLGTLLRPGQVPAWAPAWDSLTNPAAADSPLRPEQCLPAEKEAYLRLRDDKNLQDVYFYFLTKHPHQGNPLESHPILAQGKLQKDRFGLDAGRIYDPRKSPGALRFQQQSIETYDYIKVEYLRPAQECSAFQQLGLGDLLDPNTGGYQQSMLELLDRLNRDTNSSAIFRAFVSLKLFAIAEPRPLEWGFQWSPSAAKHIRTLKEMRAGELHSGDWFVPDLVKTYETPLKKQFERAAAISFVTEATFFQRLTRKACAKGFAFAGFVDAAGNPAVASANAARGEYWGWSGRSRAPALLFRQAENGGGWERLEEPLRFTPLFALLSDRGVLLDQTAQATLYPLSQASGLLPPLFSGL